MINKSAQIEDINKKYLEAIRCYEQEIEDYPSISLDNYINLAFLYWALAFEFNFLDNAPDELSIKAGDRYLEILELGLMNFPNSSELLFWKKYFKHIVFGEEFLQSECINLLERDVVTKSNVPFFFLYLFDKDKYKMQVSELIQNCNTNPTAKNLYIKSIVGDGLE